MQEHVFKQYVLQEKKRGENVNSSSLTKGYLKRYQHRLLNAQL